MNTRTHRYGRFGAVIALSLASVFATSAVAMASPVAHAGVEATLHVQGTITAVTPSTGTPTSITVQPLDAYAPSENVLLGPDTVYTQAGAPSSVSALSVGVRVQITLTGSPATAATVNLLSAAPIFVGGTVSALTPSTGTPTSVTIQPRDPHRAVVTVALNAATLYYLGGTTSTVASLVVGSQVELEATGNPATATVVKIAPPRPIWIEGTVSALTPSTGTPTSVTIQPSAHNAVPVTIALASSTVYRQAGSVVTIADLLVGSRVLVEASGNPQTATLIRIAKPQPVYVTGMVTALTPSTGTPTSVTVQPAGSFTAPITVNLSSTTVYDQLKTTVTVAALLVGSRVVITASGSPLSATVVRIAAPLPDVTIGSVTAVTNAVLTVQPQAVGATPINFTLTPTTTYFNGREVATITEIGVGDIVRVESAPSAPTTALTVIVRDLALVGRVTDVTGNVITLRGLYGQTLLVNVTPTTTYSVGKTSTTISAVHQGELIVAVGPAMSGVTKSVTASRVWIGLRDDDALYHAIVQHRFEGRRHHH
ncbi:MAG: hypothetical protein KGL23_01655 [Acidobacteriota bacterium]|nr:hypothetical protein [Acidobacteriota bacterium]MDE3030141.1 hypothetical protein [Acidobacteriota bacterium]MDE3092321.1 hypothetical protein [Acidobacteriota bacterium]MDE3146123.1 hypothetical protein [Acidobacteriota bacterium]